MIKNILHQIISYFRSREFVQDMLYGDTSLKFSDKRQIASLIAKDEFRTYEKYLKIKQRGRLKRMLHCEEKELPYIRKEVSLLAEITADHARMWKEVEEESKRATAKRASASHIFGKKRISL